MPTTRGARERHKIAPEKEQYDKGYEDEQYDEEDQYEDEAYEEDADERHDDGQVTTASAAAKAAVDQITQLTAKQPEGVIAVEPGDDGWRVSVEVIEDRRIPSSADILAIYEAAITSSGDLSSYRRIRRYGRGQGDGGDQ
jgi:Gas vesicle synthesis protein GvpO